MPVKTYYIDDIQEAEQTLEHIRHRYLETRGWKYTCNNIYAIWLWERDDAGCTLLLTPSVALQFQEAMDAKQDPEEVAHAKP